ncbi:MAG: hypothetical protein J6X10_02730 [Bacteroidales bacterium]|nr:hypothetical protein [Bacteroidales bacterium]
MDNYFDNTSMIQTVLKWKWHIIIITLVAAILGAIFSGSMFITPLFKSEATVYPTHIEEYSDETITEQMLQIMQSQQIMDSVVDKFGLLEHYKIEKSYKYWNTALIGEYRSNVSISRTPYDAVTIKVYDSDPEIACAMVYEIVNQYNLIIEKLTKNQRGEQARMFKSTLKDNEIFLDSLRERLTTIGTEYGIVDVTSQSREITRAYLNNGKSDKLNELKENLETYGPEVNIINNLLEYASENYHKTKYDFERETRYCANNISFANMVSNPFVADKKAYPIRWVVVALSALCACFISILVIYVIENKKRFVK